MILSRLLTISIFSFILLLSSIHALQYRSHRQKRAACPAPGVMCQFITCENSGQCVDDTTTNDCYKCNCADGFTGKICETAISVLPTGCSPGCQNGGICNVNVCVCLAGYTGTLCEIKDNCVPTNPCSNGGKCISTSTSFVCDCTNTGYGGVLCTEPIVTNPCLSAPCQNGGQCSWNGATMSCACINGYTGVLCQVAPIPCSGLTCQNGGQCGLIATNTYGCVCVAGYTGTQCENIDLSVHPCVTMPAVVCKNGGTCAVDDINYKCNCEKGWTGRNCENAIATATSCNPNPCLHGTCAEATLGGSTVAICSCENDWTGKFCDVNMNGNCPPGYCLSGSICRMNGNTGYCDCPALYTGARCETYIGIVTTIAPPITTATTTTPNIGSCQPNPCQNGGLCNQIGNTFSCSCFAPWSGPLCQQIIVTTTTTTTSMTGISTTPQPTGLCISQPCKNGGTCVPIGASYSCFCGLNSIYTGKNCDSTTPMPVNECPLDCAPGRCIFSGYASKPYACLWNGIMRPEDGTTA